MAKNSWIFKQKKSEKRYRKNIKNTVKYGRKTNNSHKKAKLQQRRTLKENAEL